jgi:TPR repeat protein
MSLRTRIITVATSAWIAMAATAIGLVPANAGYFDGLVAYQRGDYTTAMEEWSLSALRGDFRAQYGVGIMLLYGRGTDRDPISAVGYLSEASVRGYPEARYALGVMYQDGTGVTQDLAEAARLYEMAAWQGMAKAQNNLGILYVLGKGVETDPVLAHVWFALAEKAGEVAAISNRERVAIQLSAAQMAEAQRMTAAWKATAIPEPPPEIDEDAFPEPVERPRVNLENPAAPVVPAAPAAPAAGNPAPPLLIIPAP